MNQCVISGLPPGIEFDTQNDKLVARIQECLAHEQAESFKENLERLAGFARGGSKVRIGLDFAPLSFGFAVIRPDGPPPISTPPVDDGTLEHRQAIDQRVP